MKHKEILMLVCAFFLGFFANAIMKSSCMGKLYEGAETHSDNGDESCFDLVRHYNSQDSTHQGEGLNHFLPDRCKFSDSSSVGLGS